MGAGPWSLLTVLFRMIPRFPPTPGAGECATPAVPGTRGHRAVGTCSGAARLIRPQSPRITPPGTTTLETLTNTHPVSDVLTHHNLDAECDRSRAGTGPISARVATDLDAEYDRSRRRDAENDGSLCKTVTVVRCFYPKGRRPDTNRTSSSVVVDIPCHRSTCVPHAH